MTGFARYVYDSIVFDLLVTKQVDKKKAINVNGYNLYIVRGNNILLTESEFYEFNHIEITDKKKYDDIIDNFIKFIMNTKYYG